MTIIAAVLAGCARVQVVPTSREAVVTGAIAPALQALPLREKLEYQVSWWGVAVGTVLMETSLANEEPNSSDEEDPLPLPSALLKERLVKLTCTARSNPYLEAFYPVRVKIVSLIDPDARSPRWSYASIRRRFRFHESTITMDPTKMTAFHKLPKKKSTTVSITPVTQDGLSMLYYVRTLPFELGKTIPLEISADGKNWHLTGKIVRTGAVEVKRQGKWPAVEATAELTYPVPFFQGAKVRIWFSADGQRIPLLAKIHSRIGPVTVVLIQRFAPEKKS